MAHFMRIWTIINLSVAFNVVLMSSVLLSRVHKFMDKRFWHEVKVIFLKRFLNYEEEKIITNYDRCQ